MSTENVTVRILVNQSPGKVFDAINNVRGWWSEQIEGVTNKPDSVFRYSYKDVHICTLQITEFIPGKKVSWFVVDNYFNFTKDKNEWNGTTIDFEIVSKGDQTELVFTHIGLVPAYECYKICSDSWNNYVGNSLKALIETGKGLPNPYIPSVENADALKQKNKVNHE